MKRMPSASQRIHASHLRARKKIEMAFYRLRMHPKSYKETAKPPRKPPRRMPSRVPKGLHKEAAGIFGFLLRKANLIKRASKSSLKQNAQAIKNNPAAIAQGAAKVAASSLIKKGAKRTNKALRAVVQQHERSINTTLRSASQQAADKVRDFLKKK